MVLRIRGGLLQWLETVAPTRGLQRGMGFEGLRIRGGVASTVVDRASPVFRADEDVHNPSVDGLGTSWGVGASTVVDRASPVFSADEDVHNPSVDGSGTSWDVGASTVGDRRSYAWVATGDGI